MSLFYKPPAGWAADFIPFYWQGEHHLFYLKDYRDSKVHGEGTPWFHLGTRDFVTFTDYGEALPRGGQDEQDLYVFTGCVIEHAGVFHIFYTGHNPHFAEQGKPVQAVMHATSPDLIRWTKDPANPVLFADPSRYEMDDWRDPFVFWNDEAGEFWMLLAAREKMGPSNRRGCTALVTSPDLEEWTIQEPFWSPSLYYTHECPDLFRWQEQWVLVFSEFSQDTVTRYRMSSSLAGPWLAPANDTFDGRAFYAAKTVSDGNRRFALGWIPTREGETDTGRWQWGGHLAVHELGQTDAGGIAVHMPASIGEQFAPETARFCRPMLGDWHAEGNAYTAKPTDGFAACLLGEMGEVCRIDLTLSCDATARMCGLLLRADSELESYYQLRWEPGRERIVFDRWPRPGDDPFILERPFEAPQNGDPIRLTLLIDGTAMVAYVDDRLALSCRGYEHRAGQLGLFVSEGGASFTVDTFAAS